MSGNYRKRAGRRYIESHNTIRKSYNGNITYNGGAVVKRENKDLPTSLGANGVAIFYGKQMTRDGTITSLYHTRHHSLKRNVNNRHIIRTSEIVTNRITTVRAYNGAERHHHEALKKRRGKPSKIGNDGRYFIPKIVIMPDGISRPAKSNTERTDREWLQTRW